MSRTSDKLVALCHALGILGCAGSATDTQDDRERDAEFGSTGGIAPIDSSPSHDSALSSA